MYKLCFQGTCIFLQVAPLGPTAIKSLKVSMSIAIPSNSVREQRHWVQRRLADDQDMNVGNDTDANAPSTLHT